MDIRNFLTDHRKIWNFKEWYLIRMKWFKMEEESDRFEQKEESVEEVAETLCACENRERYADLAMEDCIPEAKDLRKEFFILKRGEKE